MSRSFVFDFEVTDPTAATRISFAIDSASGLCVLTGNGLETYTYDEPGEFAPTHYVYLLDPTANSNAELNLVSCIVDESNVLSCSVRDQNVLHVFGETLTIGTAEASALTFTMVQV